MPEVTSDRERQIQELLDKQAIREAVLRFCRGVDRHDASLINSAFHPDALDEHGGHGVYSGDIGAKTLEFIRSKERNPVHMITNQLITVDGDKAGSETYYYTCHLEMADDEELLFQSFGRYVDRFERRNGEWKIAHRVIVSGITHYIRPAKLPEPGRTRPGVGTLDRTDLSYAVLGD